jgi:hypothetical protein
MPDHKEGRGASPHEWHQYGDIRYLYFQYVVGIPKRFNGDGDGVILRLTRRNLEETDYVRQHLFADRFGRRMQAEEYIKNVFAVTNKRGSFEL